MFREFQPKLFESTAFPIYKRNPDHTKLSHLMVSIGGGLCCSGRSSSFGPWDGWNTSILGGFDGWFSLILPISPHLAPRYGALSADTSEEATPPAAACLRWHHGEWTQHHLGILQLLNLIYVDTTLRCRIYMYVQYRRFTRRNQRKFDQNWILGSSILRSQVVGMQNRKIANGYQKKHACVF